MPSERIILPELQAKVDRELDPGERIHWIDMPVPRYFTPFSTARFLFGPLWTSFIIFASLESEQANSPVPYIFIVPLFLVGLWVLCTPLWEHWKSLNTIYAITNKKAILIEGGWTITTRNYPPEKISDVFRRDQSEGRGDVLFARISCHDSDGDDQSQELGFLNIENPKDVEAMLKQLAEQVAK